MSHNFWVTYLIQLLKNFFPQHLHFKTTLTANLNHYFVEKAGPLFGMPCVFGR